MRTLSPLPKTVTHSVSTGRTLTTSACTLIPEELTLILSPTPQNFELEDFINVM